MTGVMSGQLELDIEPAIPSAILIPTHPLMRDNPVMYMAHVQELIARAKAGGDTRLATDAEMCCGFADASLKAPLTDEGMALYSQAFRRVFPDRYVEAFGDEDYVARCGDLLLGQMETDLRHKARREWRR